MINMADVNKQAPPIAKRVVDKRSTVAPIKRRTNPVNIKETPRVRFQRRRGAT
jgi:hypothetical protein